MVTNKSSQWNKKDKTANKGNGAFKPRVVPAIAKDRDIPPDIAPVTDRPEPPPYEDYLPYNDAEGTDDKADGRKRMMILVDADGTQMQPIKWFNMSVIEATIVASEVTRVMTMELAQAVIKREAEIQEQAGKQDEFMGKLEATLAKINGVTADGGE